MIAHRYPMPTRTDKEKSFLSYIEQVASTSVTSHAERATAWPVWAPRQTIGRFLAQYELYKEVVGLHGCVIEGGVAFGAGLMTWCHLASVLEHPNHTRRVVGFDTFAGFPRLSDKDSGAVKELAHEGAMEAPVFEELNVLLEGHDMNRPIGHIPRAELVRGNACETIPAYVAAHPDLVVALLTIDFDLYEPADVALTYFLPRMYPGAIVVFDEVSAQAWPGETLAYLKHKHKLGTLQRSPLTSTLSWARVL